MYSEQLEQLIQSVIADGVITEKERGVLHKKAAAEGVDEDEIDVYVDGLIAKMEQAVTSAKKNKQYDLSKCNKVVKDYYTYYELPSQLDAGPLLPDCPIAFIKVGIIRVTDVPPSIKEEFKEKIKALYIVITGQVKEKKDEGWIENPIIETNIGTSHLSKYDNGYEMLAKPAYMQPGKHCFWGCYRIDEDILKMFCNAEIAKIKTTVVWDKEGKYSNRSYYSIDNACLPAFDKYAQLAYHVLVDDTAYTNAEEELKAAMSEGKANAYVAMSLKGKDEFTAKDPEDNGVIYAKLLGKKPALMQKDKEEIPCWEKFTDQETGFVVYHFSDNKGLSATAKGREYKFEWLFHAIQEKENKIKFIFELTCTCQDKSDSNNNKLPKIPFGLTEGSLQVNVAGKNLLLPPLTSDVLALTGQYTKVKGDERCYYEVPSTLLSVMSGTKDFGLKVFGSNNKSANLKSMFGGISMPKKWNLAYNLLIHPEQKELLLQEYHDSLISTKVGKFFKGLFGKNGQ